MKDLALHAVDGEFQLLPDRVAALGRAAGQLLELPGRELDGNRADLDLRQPLDGGEEIGGGARRGEAGRPLEALAVGRGEVQGLRVDDLVGCREVVGRAA